MSVIVLVCLLALSSVVSIKLSFEIPGVSNALLFDTGNCPNFYKPVTAAAPQNKIFDGPGDECIMREPIMVYLEKQENSPPGLAFYQ